MKRRDIFTVLLIFAFPFIDAVRNGYVVDDAFITFRYARNLVEGAGLVFNPGERVEGYTNFLWTILTTPALLLKIDPLLYSRILSVLAGIGTLLLLVLFLKKRPDSGPIAVFIAPLLLACQASFSVWLLAGLETVFFTFLVTGGILAFLNRRDGTVDTWPILLVLASLTRPDGLLFLSIAYTLASVEHLRKRRPGFGRFLVYILLPFLILFVPYVIWKFYYYGSLVPNTFHAKVGSGTSQLIRGFIYLKAFFHKSGGPVLLLPLVLLANAGGRRILLSSLFFIVPYCLYVLLVGGDAMVKFRFLLPILPILCFLIARAIILVSRLVPGRVWSGGITTVLVILSISFTLDFDRSLVSHRRELVKDWVETGAWLADNFPVDTVIALGAIGAIPYYSRFRTIDIFGLTEPAIAVTENESMGTGLPGHERANGAYVLSKNPDLIIPKVVLTENPPARDRLSDLFTGSKAEMEILRHPAFRRNYRPVTVRLKRGYLTFFRRID